MGYQVLPPSTDTRPGLPPVKIFWSFAGSTRIWLKYMGRSLQVLICVHVLPPSSERYTPSPSRSGLGGVAAAAPRPPAPPPPLPPVHTGSLPAGHAPPPSAPPPPPPPALPPAAPNNCTFVRVPAVTAAESCGPVTVPAVTAPRSCSAVIVPAANPEMI